MTTSHTLVLPPSADVPPAEISPRTCRTLAELGTWWREEMVQRVPHDFSVVGIAPAGLANITLPDIVLVHGPVQAEKDLLLAYCRSLLSVWGVMRQAALLDLGPCTCVGESRMAPSTARHRTFLVHSVEAGDGRMSFAILASSAWDCPDTAKRVLASVMPELAACLSRIPVARGSTAPGAGAEPQSGRVTPREREIGDLVRAGLTNKEIARSLQLSPHTVRNQVAHLSQKLGARNRAQLALLMPEQSAAAVASFQPRPGQPSAGS